MKLSIIVPVYNVELYIKQCIESLINQSIDDFEIIVVDDGSKDRSIEIVEKIEDDRIKIIHKENGGLSSARNSGLKVAKGEYIAFVDSDDFIADKDSYRDMIRIAEDNNSDMVVGNCIWYYSDERDICTKFDESFFVNRRMNAKEFLSKSIKSERIYSPVWLSIYRRKLFDNSGLKFKEGILHEDELFTPQAIILSNNISIYERAFYIYRQREGSITNNKNNLKRASDILDISKELYRIYNNISDNEFKNIMLDEVYKSIVFTIYRYKIKEINDIEIKDIMKGCNNRGLKLRWLLFKFNPYIYFEAEKIKKKLK